MPKRTVKHALELILDNLELLDPGEEEFLLHLAEDIYETLEGGSDESTP